MIELSLPTYYSVCNGKMISFYALIRFNSTGESTISINNTHYVLKDSLDNDYIITKSGYVTIILDTESSPRKAIILHDDTNHHQPMILPDFINLATANIWETTVSDDEYIQSIDIESYPTSSLSADSSIDICYTHDLLSLMESSGVKFFWLEVCVDSSRENPVYIKAHTIGNNAFAGDISIDVLVSC